MSSIQDSNLQQPSYEPYDPDTEIQDTADAHVLLVRLLPDFTRHQVGAYHEVAHKRIRVFGEKPTENNKRIRFSKVYTIPEDCDADKLKGVFREGGIITITIPKKPKETEQEPAQEQEAAKQVTATPPQKPPSEVESDGEKGVPEEKSKSEIEKPKEPEPAQEQEAAKQVTATSPQKPPSEVESDGEKGVLEEKPKSEMEKPKEPEPELEPAQEQEAAKQVTATPPQKPPSEVEPEAADMKNGEKGVPEEKPKLEMEKSKEPEPEPAQEQEAVKQVTATPPQKLPSEVEPEVADVKNGEKGVPEEKPKLKMEKPKLKMEKPKEPEPAQEQEAAKQVTTTPPQKPASKVELEVEDMKNGEKGVPEEKPKSKTEKPKKPKLAQEQEAVKQVTATPPQTSKEKEKKHMGVQTDKVNEERSHENTVSSEPSSTSKGMIKNMASSASEAVTRLANRFSEEDTQKKLLCAGATILVVAVGIYASLKLRSMTRQ